MAKKEPLWKKFSEWWPLVAVCLAALGWITNVVVSHAKDEEKLDTHEKRLQETEQKNSEQDKEITKNEHQYELIQQALGGISEQLKELKHR